MALGKWEKPGCKLEWCDNKPKYAKGLCVKHYRRLQKNGHFNKDQVFESTEGTCEIENCENKIKAKGLCNKCYVREYRKKYTIT